MIIRLYSNIDDTLVIPNEVTTASESLSKAIESDKYVSVELNNVIKRSYANLTIVNEEEIQTINNENRGIDKVTDVLSFPMLNMKDGKLIDDIMPSDFEIDEEGNEVICLGDIIICLDKAKAQADEYEHSYEREVSFLIGHSLLHLLGYDHIEENDEKIMLLKQKNLMADIGLAFEDELLEITNHADDFNIDQNTAYPAGTPCDHAGYCALLGRPNVGKSTLINYITGMKVAIVSHKPQTTRTNIRSIYNTDNTQIVFVDTPGVHKPDSKLSRIMVDKSFNSAKNADVVLMIADGRFNEPGSVEKRLLELCKKNNKKVILAINKTDAVTKESILPIIASYSSLFTFEDIIPISAKTGRNVDVLLELIAKTLPEGPRMFDSEYMTDQTEREISKELIREQLLHYTNQEIPHGTAVEITKFDERYPDNKKDEYDRNMVVIEASIICEKQTHKAIIIGKDGQMIKRIGMSARRNIERLLGCKVYLDLYVKVREDWKNSDTLLKQFGYEEDPEE